MRPDHRSYRLVFVTAAIAAMLVIGHYFGFTKPAEILVRNVVAPVNTGWSYLGRGLLSVENIFQSNDSLRHDNEQLRRQLGEALAKNAELAAFQQDLQAAEPLLKYLQPVQQPVVLARIIGQESDPISREVTVNRGTNDGLAVGQPAIVDMGVLVGKVIQADEHTARVRLLLDSRSAVASVVEQGSGTPGLTIGERGLTLRLTLIPKDSKIAAGDKVVTSGIEPEIPRGLIIGAIQEVVQPVGELFLQARITPALSFDHLSVIGFLVS